MPDKNPDYAAALKRLADASSKRNLSIIMASEPFHKAELVNSLLDYVDCPAILLDFDLLYSGYLKSGLIPKRPGLHLFCPHGEADWNKALHSTLAMMVQNRFMVIVDSLNGLHSIHPGKDSARFVNASLMLLAFVGRLRQCPVVVITLAKKSRARWVLSPGGRTIMTPKNSQLYTLDRTDTLHIKPEPLQQAAGSDQIKTAL